jgi:hypothetical protein
MTVSVAMLGERALRRLGVAVVPEADRPPLATTIPAATLATNALTILGVIASDETPLPSDQALALAKVNAVHDSLVANANVRWSVNAVPQAVSEEYARLAGLEAASAFGKQVDPQMLTVLEGRVRKVAMIMQAPDEASLAVMAVHNDLSARGLVRWSSQDIPDAAGTAYMMLAANLLAPGFGAQADPQAGALATTSLARMIALPTSGERTVAEYF